MTRRGRVMYDGREAGWIEELDRGMRFQYSSAWLDDASAPTISRTLPKRPEPFVWDGPAPFFMGLLPEGWLHRIALDSLRIAPDDWFAQLLHLCRDCIGAVHLEAERE